MMKDEHNTFARKDCHRYRWIVGRVSMHVRVFGCKLHDAPFAKCLRCGTILMPGLLKQWKLTNSVNLHVRGTGHQEYET